MSPLTYETAALVALGSNQPLDATAPAVILERALQLLSERGYVIRARSGFYATPAFPAGAGPDFVNAAAVIEGGTVAAQVLADLHAVEAALGRERKGRWGARTLDLDLIALGDQVLPDAQTHGYWRDLPLEAQRIEAPRKLILPHPRLAERAFVLVPLRDVAPDWRHPVSGKSVREMHDALSPEALAEVVAL